jgi:hypothetical protein
VAFDTSLAKEALAGVLKNSRLFASGCIAIANPVFTGTFLNVKCVG